MHKFTGEFYTLGKFVHFFFWGFVCLDENSSHSFIL